MQKAIIIIFILLIIILGLLFYIKEDEVKSDDNPTLEAVEEKKLKITFLDIGQGDATFIEFTNGQQMLVDCAIDARVIEALGRVMEYWDHEIDYMLVTHPDLDHYGGCEEVLKRFDVKNIFYTGLKKEFDDTWNSWQQAIQAEGANYIEIESEEEWQIGSTTLHFLYPDHSIVVDRSIPEMTKETSDNNTSIVFELEYNDNEVLFMGDAEVELEKYLLDVYGDQMNTDLLKAGHHGSAGASSQEFVDKATPEYTIFSCGLDNVFGHPSPRVLKRLERASSTIWRTDWQGDIIALIGDQIEVVNN
ncbi:MAG: MBL fold metallo-hydrolase [Candidatus Magasanikbacteria bacterium]